MDVEAIFCVERLSDPPVSKKSDPLQELLHSNFG
jgi:superfamily II DNA or RNA helicase